VSKNLLSPYSLSVRGYLFGWFCLIFCTSTCVFAQSNSKVSQENRKFSYAQCMRASDYYEHGQARKALSCCELALSADDKNGNAYLLKGFIESELDEVGARKTLSDLERGFSLVPAVTGSRMSNFFDAKAKALSELGRVDEALQTYNKALALNPRNYIAQGHMVFPQSILYRGRASIYCKKGEFRRAIDDLTQAARCNPESISNYMERAKVYVHLKEYDKAVTDFTKVISIEPSNLEAYSRRAEMYKKLGRADLAKRDYVQPDDSFREIFGPLTK